MTPKSLNLWGIRDYFRPQTLCLLEWASRGKGMIPEADIIIQIDYASEGRHITLHPQTSVGNMICANFSENSTA